MRIDFRHDLEASQKKKKKFAAGMDGGNNNFSLRFLEWNKPS